MRPWCGNNFFIKPHKKDGKRFVWIYGCCVKEDIGESLPVEDFEKILDSDIQTFEDFVNSYWKKYSCIQNEKLRCFDAETSRYKKNGKFQGINNCLLDFCNIRCEFCRWQNERELYTKEDKEYYKNLYYRLLDKFAESSFQFLRLTEYGEPLIFFDENVKFFEKIKKKKTIAITTNGILLDKYVPIFEKYKDTIKFDICVSLNAYNAEIYKQKMGVDKFDKVLDNALKARDFLARISFFLYDYEMQDKEIYRKYQDFKMNVLSKVFPLGQVEMPSFNDIRTSRGELHYDD